MSGKQPKSLLSAVWHAALVNLLFISFAHGQTTALTFRPVAAEYSLALDRIIMISSNPNLLHIYDPSSNADVTVRLSDSPLNLSISPDGLHAAVAYSNSVDYVNLQSGAIERNYAASVVRSDPYSNGALVTGKVVLGSTYLYILSDSRDNTTISVDLSTGTPRYNTTFDSLESGSMAVTMLQLTLFMQHRVTGIGWSSTIPLKALSQVL